MAFSQFDLNWKKRWKIKSNNTLGDCKIMATIAAAAVAVAVADVHWKKINQCKPLRNVLFLFLLQWFFFYSFFICFPYKCFSHRMICMRVCVRVYVYVWCFFFRNVLPIRNGNMSSVYRCILVYIFVFTFYSFSLLFGSFPLYFAPSPSYSSRSLAHYYILQFRDSFG